MRFVDGEERNRNAGQPVDGVLPCQPFGREIKQAVRALHRGSDNAGLLGLGERAVQDCGRNSHLRQVRRLILHQRNQRRDDDCGAIGCGRGQLVAERFASTRGHYHRHIVARKNTGDNSFLHGPKIVVTPIAAQCGKQVGLLNQDIIVAS